MMACCVSINSRAPPVAANPALLEPETAHFYEDEPPRSPQLLVQWYAVLCCAALCCAMVRPYCWRCAAVGELPLRATLPSRLAARSLSTVGGVAFVCRAPIGTVRPSALCSQKPLNGETPHALLVGAFVTPADIHFVRNHMPVPRGPKAAEHRWAGRGRGGAQVAG